MKKQRYRHFVLILAALLAFQSCRKEIHKPDTGEVPEIVLRAQEWIREHEVRSRGQELDLGTLDFLWEDYVLERNDLGQAIVSVPARNSVQTGGDYMELAFGVDEEGVPQGMVKRYTGDMAGGSVLLRLYTVAGQKAMSGTYHPATGKFREAPISTLDKPVKIARVPEMDIRMIETVYVTGFRGSGGGGYHFVSIQPAHVGASRGNGGVAFPIHHGGSRGRSRGGGQPSPYYIKIEFACGSGNTDFKNNVEKTLNNLKNGKVGRSDYGCFPTGILKAVQGKQGANGVLKFCLKEAGSGASGTYRPSTSTMGYIHHYVNDMSTLHEILHYYQDLSGHYPSMGKMGIGSNGKASKGFANIEFEVRLILDIMKGYGDEYIYELEEPKLLSSDELGAIKDGYGKFIDSFRGKNGELLNPEVMDITKFKADYNNFLDYYATKSKNYQSEVDKTMEPKALIELLKGVYNSCK